MNERHPDLGPDLARRGFLFRITDVGTLDAIPDNLVTRAPFDEPLDSVRNEPEFPGDFGTVMDGWIDVERRNIAALDVFRVVLRMIAPHATANVIVPGHALA